MEENNNRTVVIDVDLSDYIKQLDEMRKTYDETAKSIKDLANAEGEDAKKRETLIQQNKVLAQEMRGVEKQMQNEIKQHKANEGSLVSLRAELSNLQKKYDQMPATMRDMGDEGTKTKKKIQELTEQIQGLEESTGRWQRNVGNYKSALRGLKDGFEGVGLSTNGLNASMKLLSENPWMTVIGFLLKIVIQLSEKMKDNVNVTDALGRAVGALQPIFDWFSKAVSKLADIFSNVLDWAIQKTIEALGWLGRQLQKVGKLFGKDWGSGLIVYSSQMQQAATDTETMAEATDNLVTSQETLQGAVKKTRDALETFLDTYKRVLREVNEDSLYDMLMKAGGTKTGAEVIAEMTEAADQLDTTLKKMDASIDDSNLNANNGPGFLEKFSADFLNNAQTIESVSSSLQASFGSLSSIYKQMAQDETKTEEEREKAAKQAKAWAAIQIAANAGTAVAKGVASAVDVGFPAAIPAMAAMTAAVLAAIAQAKALAAEGHEQGGVIGGFRGATYGKDNTYIHARTGEMVLNAGQQRQLFEIANGGGSGVNMAAELAAAIQSMPAPVLDYKEFTTFQNRVVSLNEATKLK